MRIQYYHKKDNSSVVTGLYGANCYHDYYPVVPGISKPTYTPEEIEEFNRKENEPVEYNGKKYNKYEATQRQRKLETTMRAQRQEIKLLKEGGANEDDLIAARSRYRGTSAEYARFSKAMDLPQQRERVTVDGLGNIGQGKHTKTDNVNNKSVDIQEKTVYDEFKLNRMKIQETLHNVEEKRRTLDYEVGTIIDREGNVVEEIGGEAHSVSVDRNMEDMIFTHNHPSGGCFSGGDIYSMSDDKLLEFRTSTPQGTYFSLLRTSKSTFDTTFADEYKEAISYKNAIKAVTEELKSGIISKEDVKSRGFALYVEYMSKAGEVYLTENAE